MPRKLFLWMLCVCWAQHTYLSTILHAIHSFLTRRCVPTIIPLQNDHRRKQGAYGKIKTHKESKVSQLMHVDEVFSAVSLLYISPLKSNLENDYVKKTYNADDLAFCDEILCKVSRSFAAVIRQLPPTLLVDVLIFYLVLRALDTIEDDMTAFENNDIKVKHLMSFHKTALVDPEQSCGMT